MKLAFSFVAIVLASFTLAEAEFDFGSVISALINEPSLGTLKEDAYVTIANGTLKGYTSEANNGRTIYNFKGIPYAKPPVGDLRFRAPQILEEGFTENTFDATRTAPACPQYLTALSPASEDCLYLNVHTPRSQDEVTNPLPVMVFMHGGGFAFGDSVIYGPRKLLAQDVVLVVPHYRLGALGFLSTGDEVSPGNYGLKDMVQTLRWVQENIAAFGGDPNLVTLFGESAGSAGSSLLLLSPLTTGLFHRVIMQSGTALTPFAMDRTPWESAKRYAVRLGCPTDTSANLIACLRTKDFKELAKASFEKLVGDLASLQLVFEATSGVIEPNLPGALITEEPLSILERGDFPNIPIMLGAVQHEGSAVLGAAYSLNMGPRGDAEDPKFIRDKLLPTLLNAVGIDELSHGGAAISQSLILSYLPYSPREDWTEVSEGLTDLLSVVVFKAPILRTTELLVANNSNVFLYSFEHEGFNSLWTLAFDLLSTILGAQTPPMPHGVMHADDLVYFFTVPMFIVGKDREFSDMVCSIWADFAKTGNPTSGATPAIPEWPAYTIEKSEYYKLVLEPEVKLGYTNNWRQGWTRK